MTSFPILRLMLPVPILLIGMVLLVVLLGRGTRSLSSQGSLTAAEVAELKAQASEEVRAPVGIHSVGEWPTGRGRIFQQAPSLDARVESGELPPVEDRLPRDPLVIRPPEQLGPYGGTWKQFGTGPGDVGVVSNLLPYESLLRWDPMMGKILPNLVTRWTVEEDGKLFTFHIREGVRWSDGHPFSVDDIVFFYRHVLSNPELTPVVIPAYLREGKLFELEKVGEHSFQIRFAVPNGMFIAEMASPRSGDFISYPAHYFRQFHPEFGDRDDLNRRARAAGFGFWHQVFLDKTEWHNVERPVLRAWRISRPPPAREITFERNPYYWKVDPEGNQLPYIDRLNFEISAVETMLLRFLRGDMGLQQRHVDLQSYALLQENRHRGDYRFVRWISSMGTVLTPNMNHRDPVMKEIISDRRFRIALSHAINREELNEAVYSGMGQPMQMAPSTISPLYRPEYTEAFLQYDPDQANRLLDEMGLHHRNRQGIRLRPDGRPLQLTIDMFEMLANVEAMQLVAAYWTRVGIKTEVKQLARSLFYTRIPARLHDVAVSGQSTLHTPLYDQNFFVPRAQGARHAMAYATWLRTDGRQGEEPPEEIKRLGELYKTIEITADLEVQHALAHEILEINRHHLWVIGLVGEISGLTLVHNSFRNVPDVSVIFGVAGGVTAPECYAIEEN